MTAYNAKQTAKALHLAVAFARIPAHEADNHAAGLAQPVAFPWLIFQLLTETTPYRETVAFPCSLSARFCSVCCLVSVHLHSKLLN